MDSIKSVEYIIRVYGDGFDQQVGELIRCTDCKHYEPRVSFNGLFDGYCNCCNISTSGYCYCYWGERKEE